MFTGIIQALGTIQTVTAIGSGADYGIRIQIHCPAGFMDDVALGDSIAINGACMTVTTLESNHFTADVSAHSLSKITEYVQGKKVNLEKALRPIDHLGGHYVSGHVDGMGSILAMTSVGESTLFQITIPEPLCKYMAVKGSVTVAGVSLTVNAVEDHFHEEKRSHSIISINLIPHTLQHTILGTLAVGDPVNIEIDLIARYVERIQS